MRIGVVAELRHADTADVLLWDSYTDAVPCVKKLVQEYFPIIRQEFLQFICDIGRHTVDGATISEQFRLLTYFSAWEYSSLFERHPAYYGDALFTIFKLRALELYCQKVRPQEVCLCGCDDVARHISSICKAQQITFVHSPSSVNSKEGPDGPSCSAMAFVRKSASMVRQLRGWWKQVRSQFPAQPVVRRCKGMILGTWFPNIDQEAAQAGRFRSKYWEDAHDLIDSSATPQHWFFIYADREQSIPDHIASRDRFAANAPNADMTFLEECLTPCDALRAFGLWLRSAWRSSIMGNRVAEAFNWPHSALNVFSLLQDIWQESTSGWHLLRMLLHLQAVKRFCKLVGPQDRVLTSSELQWWERMLFREQRKLGCSKNFAVQHSIIRAADFRFFCAPNMWQDKEFADAMPDVFFCNGRAGLEAMRASGFPDNRLGLVEATRFLYLARATRYAVTFPSRKLLVATSYFEGETRRMLEMLAAAMKERHLPLFDNVQIKAHPDLPVDHILSELFTDPPAIVTQPVESYLKEDTAIFAAAGTSVTLLVAYMGLPMVVAGSDGDFEMGCLDAFEGICYARSAKELLDGLTMSSRSTLPEDYFCLDASLARWKKMLTSQ